MENIILELFNSGVPFAMIVSALLFYVLLVKLSKIEALLIKITTSQNQIIRLLILKLGDDLRANAVMEDIDGK